MEQMILPKQKISLWQILFYLSMGVVVLWLILKFSGVIQTPWWLEFGIPIAGLVLGIFTLYHNLMRAINRIGIGLATLTVKVDHIQEKVDHFEKDMILVKKKLHL